MSRGSERLLGHDPKTSTGDQTANSFEQLCNTWRIFVIESEKKMAQRSRRDMRDFSRRPCGWDCDS
jgi:hypothetical protein